MHFLLLTLLITKVYTSSTDIKETEKLISKNSESSSKSSTDNTNQNLKEIEEMIKNHENYFNIYKKIVDKFLFNFNITFENNSDVLKFTIAIPNDYKPNDIEKLYELEDYNIPNKYPVFEFNLDLFFEYAKFVIETVKRLETQKDKTICEQESYSDYVMAVKWLYSLAYPYKKISTLEYYDSCIVFYNKKNKSTVFTFTHKKIADSKKIARILTNNEKQKNIKDSNKSAEYIIYTTENHFEDLKDQIDIVFDKMNISDETRFIDLISNLNYYEKNTRENKTTNNEIFENTPEQKLNSILRTTYCLYNNILHIYKTNVTKYFSSVNEVYDINVNQLLLFTKQINDFMFEDVKNKINTQILAYFENKIESKKHNKLYLFLRGKKKIYKDTSKKCAKKLKKLKNPYVSDANINNTLRTLEKLNTNDLYGNAISKYITYLKKHEKQKGEITNKVQITLEEIYKTKIYCLFKDFLDNIKEIIKVKIELSKVDQDQLKNTFTVNDTKVKTNPDDKKSENPSSQVSYKNDEIIKILYDTLTLNGMIVDAQKSIYEILKYDGSKKLSELK